jgi:hypothetical protein
MILGSVIIIKDIVKKKTVPVVIYSKPENNDPVKNVIENFKETSIFDDISHNILSIYRSTLRLQVMEMIYHYGGAKDEIERLYSLYRESGGNGYITKLVSDWRDGKRMDEEPNLSEEHISAVLKQKELTLKQIIEKTENDEKG